MFAIVCMCRYLVNVDYALIMDKATMSAVLQLYAYKPWLSVVFYECWRMKCESDSIMHLLREGLHPDISHHVGALHWNQPLSGLSGLHINTVC